MDLLQSVRKEGSRGGVDFSWDDVKGSQHRENYLGHSLMAPVGRWQKNKDLSWYAKGDEAELTPEQRAEKERERKKEELRKVKEAEEDAMARALGLPVPDRTNANLEPLGMDRATQKEMNDALKEALDDGEKDEKERGIGFGTYGGGNGDGGKEVLKGSRVDGRRREKQEQEEGGDDRPTKRRRRSRSRSNHRDRDRVHKHRHHERSRSRSRDRRRRSDSRDRHQDYDRHRRRSDRDTKLRSRETERRRRSRSRSRSPYDRRHGGRDR